MRVNTTVKETVGYTAGWNFLRSRLYSYTWRGGRSKGDSFSCALPERIPTNNLKNAKFNSVTLHNKMASFVRDFN
jgi:hypothetical protein